LDTMRREIQVLRRLSHPGVVRVVDAGLTAGAPWYAMEVLKGPTLREWLAVATAADGHAVEPTLTRPFTDDGSDTTPVLGAARSGLTPERWPEAARMFSALCQSLAYLHGEGVVHRDLKPDNVFLRDDNTPVMVDF